MQLRKKKKNLTHHIKKLAAGKLPREKKAFEEDSIMGIIGMGFGDGAPVARNHDSILYKQGEPHVERRDPSLRQDDGGRGSGYRTG